MSREYPDFRLTNAEQQIVVMQMTIEQMRPVYDAAMAWYRAKYGSVGDITEIVKYREVRMRDACAKAEEVERG